MNQLNSFNVRAYAICVHENKVLSVQEKYEDVIYSKLPGGGVEFGEGLIECLHREFKEELNLDIEVTEHLYTQENFVQSLFDDGKQLLFVYYTARILNIDALAISSPDITGVQWIDFEGDNPLELPVDKIAFQLYKEKMWSAQQPTKVN